MSDITSIPPPVGLSQQGAAPAGHRMAVESRTIRSIMALILREMTTRFGRKPGGYVWAILQPLSTILVMSFAWSLLMRSPSLGTSFLLYKATGLLILVMFKEIGSVVGKALSYSKALLFYPGVTWVDALLSRFILNAVLMIAITSLIIGGVMFFEDIRTVLNWPKIFLAVSLTLGLGFGIGALNCYLFERVPVYQNLWSILTTPLLIISGVIVHYEALPEIAQRYLWYNPVLHLTGIMRDGFYPMYRPEYVSVTYVMLWALVPMFLGLMLVRKHNKDLINR